MITQEQEKEIILLRAKGWSLKKIARQMTVSIPTVRKYTAHPANQARQALVARELGLTPKERREIQKEIAMRYIQENYEEFCEFMLAQVRAKDPKGFAMVMQGLEKVEKIAGSAVGEGQKVEISGIPAAQIDLKVLINQILGKGNGHSPV